MFFFSFFVPFFMYVVSLFLSYKSFFVDKIDSYECGFDLVGGLHFGFSVVFFFIVLVFVVFELEVIIFIVLIGGDFYSFFSFFIFFFYVVFGFYLELFFGKLFWFI